MIVNVTHVRSVKALGEVANKAAEQGKWKLAGLFSHAQHLIVTLDDKVNQQEDEITKLKAQIAELVNQVDPLRQALDREREANGVLQTDIAELQRQINKLTKERTS